MSADTRKLFCRQRCRVPSCPAASCCATRVMASSNSRMLVHFAAMSGRSSPPRDRNSGSWRRKMLRSEVASRLS